MSSRPTRPRRLALQQQSRAKWTTPLTKILADTMVDQARQGNRSKSSFNRKAWKSICDDFHKKTGLSWDMEQLKNRFSVMKRQYTTVKSLFDEGSFSWDEFTGTIVANDDAWETYIRDHPDAEVLKSAGCPIYRELCIIFSEPMVNGRDDQLADYKGGASSVPPFCEPLSTVNEDSSSDSGEHNNIADQDKSEAATPRNAAARKRGRKGIDDAIAGAILEMVSASKLRTDAIRQHDTRYSISNCIKELDEIQGVEGHIYFAALDLFDDPVAREIFLSLKMEKRITWLYRKCTGSLSRLHEEFM